MDDLSLSDYVDYYDLTESTSFPIASAYFGCFAFVNRDNGRNAAQWTARGWEDIIKPGFEEELGDKYTPLDQSQMTDSGYCRDETFLVGMLNIAGERDSFLSWGLSPAQGPGTSNEDENWSSARPNGKVRFYPSLTAGNYYQLLKIQEEVNPAGKIGITRLGSGKVMTIGPQDTAFPWRKNPLMMRLEQPVLVQGLGYLKQEYPEITDIGGYYGLSDSYQVCRCSWRLLIILLSDNLIFSCTHEIHCSSHYLIRVIGRPPTTAQTISILPG